MELEQGASNLSNLKKKLINMGFDSNVSMMAVGWLAREDKLHIDKEGKKWNINLK